jgi:hypothetical protein
MLLRIYIVHYYKALHALYMEVFKGKITSYIIQYPQFKTDTVSHLRESILF